MRKPFLVFSGCQGEADTFDSQYACEQEALGQARRLEDGGEFVQVHSLVDGGTIVYDTEG